MKISKKYLLVAAVATVLGSGFMSDANASAVPNPTEITIEDICSPKTLGYIKNELEDKKMSLIWNELKDVRVHSVEELVETLRGLKTKLECEAASNKSVVCTINQFLRDPSPLFVMLSERDGMVENLNHPTPEFIDDLCDIGSTTNRAFIWMMNEMLTTMQNPGIYDIEFSKIDDSCADESDKCLHFSPGREGTEGNGIWIDSKIYCMIAMYLVASQTRFVFMDYLPTSTDAQKVYRALATGLSVTKGSEDVYANIAKFYVNFADEIDLTMARHLCTLLRNGCIRKLELCTENDISEETHQALQVIADGVKEAKGLDSFETDLDPSVFGNFETDDDKSQECISVISESEDNS